MQIQELLNLTYWFEDNIVENEILEKYSAFFSKVNQNATRPANQPAQPFETEKDNLYETLNNVTFQSLSLEQIKFLDSLEISELLGENGVNLIESVLHENTFDIATVAQKIQDFLSRIQNAQNVLTKIQESLSEHFETEDSEIPGDSVLMRVYFQNEVSMKNLTDFKKLSATWYEIGRGIAMAQNHSPEDFKIIGAQKGSLIIELAVLVGIAKAISTILLSGLKVADRVINILKKAEELKELKLKNRKIVNELKKEAEQEKEKGVGNILDEAIKDLKLKPNEEGDKVAALEKSIRKLVDFTQNGGAVDFVQADEEEEDEEGENNKNLRPEARKLRENISEIRLLEDKIKLLEEGRHKEDN
jgi:hypothetical protein